MLNVNERRTPGQRSSAGLLCETTVPVTDESEHPETLTALADGQLQHLVQLLVGVVGREAQLVKTRQRTTESQRAVKMHFFYKCMEK